MCVGRSSASAENVTPTPPRAASWCVTSRRHFDSNDASHVSQARSLVSETSVRAVERAHAKDPAGKPDGSGYTVRVADVSSSFSSSSSDAEGKKRGSSRALDASPRSIGSAANAAAADPGPGREWKGGDSVSGAGAGNGNADAFLFLGATAPAEPAARKNRTTSTTPSEPSSFSSEEAEETSRTCSTNAHSAICAKPKSASRPTPAAYREAYTPAARLISSPLRTHTRLTTWSANASKRRG
mmetsp:Transcript_15714/g.66206  ORF Transcript_15714/g.66206 Transcript_15714/m.66206 type:complete len:241 (+) Transcript_15714:1727-2449(+)